MKLIRDTRSPNFTDTLISVEYLVIHYTATTLQRTLQIFTEPDKVSSHLVIDTDGTVYELVNCMEGSARKAWHAGKSRYRTPAGVEVEGFNDRSIGVELVNLNGNVFSYSRHQYAALSEVIHSLQKVYPALIDPERILGHEQISGFRGKCDPGRQFDWSGVYATCFLGASAPKREAICTADDAARIYTLVQSVGVTRDADGAPIVPAGVPPAFFETLSSLVEGMLVKC